MLYKDILNLITFADGLILYIEKQFKNRESTFGDIMYLIYIERIFDTKGRSLYFDQEGFDITEDQRREMKKQVTESMDRIRQVIPNFIDLYGRDEFKREYKSLHSRYAEEWVGR